MPSPGVYRIKSADKHAEPLYAGNPPSQIKLGAAVTAVTENESFLVRVPVPGGDLCQFEIIKPKSADDTYLARQIHQRGRVEIDNYPWPWEMSHGHTENSYRIEAPSKGLYWTLPTDSRAGSVIKLLGYEGNPTQDWVFVPVQE
ncbi:hypothetical protein CTheo_4027 [Ceratobasidium theobromae]|uniref:Ricin B lectin domain-containing protein n=1 Tax=Ceratobasidium theobromae TaxID=1582974 RepID=A0A5N5QLD2_9AGAM|nr:hypothetical protein CTheo_4027 [Ceratobasidium theobromae]